MSYRTQRAVGFLLSFAGGSLIAHGAIIGGAAIAIAGIVWIVGTEK